MRNRSGRKTLAPVAVRKTAPAAHLFHSHEMGDARGPIVEAHGTFVEPVWHLLKGVHACNLVGLTTIQFAMNGRDSPFEQHGKDINIYERIKGSGAYLIDELHAVEYRMIALPFHQCAIDEEIDAHPITLPMNPRPNSMTGATERHIFVKSTH